MGGTDFFLDLSMNEITKLGGKENKQMSLKKELTQHQIYRKSFALSFHDIASFLPPETDPPQQGLKQQDALAEVEEWDPPETDPPQQGLKHGQLVRVPAFLAPLRKLIHHNKD